VVSTAVNGATLAITAIGDGSTVVTVGAEDPRGATASTSFTVIAGLATNANSDDLPPSEFRLGANYPNPFAGKTTIPFSLPEPGQVTLKVFDLLGNEVATLIDRNLPSGKHEFAYSSVGLPPGIYLVRLEAGSQSAIESIVVGL